MANHETTIEQAVRSMQLSLEVFALSEEDVERLEQAPTGERVISIGYLWVLEKEADGWIVEKEA